MIRAAGWLYFIGFIILVLPNFFNWLAESHPLNLLVFWLLVLIFSIATVMLILVGRPKR